MRMKICIITGTRAEYGLLRWVMEEIQSDPDLDLQVVATGMHLSPEFGLTYQEIEKDGFKIDRKVEILVSSDTPVGTSKSIGLGLLGFADVFNELNPDLIVILGDRFEIFSAAASAMTFRIPIAHLHGGESTEGSIDEAIRHSVTKMSHIHFVANEDYRRRVIQLGEQPDQVFTVGGLGLDNIERLKLLGRTSLEEEINFKLSKKNLMITFHPVTLEDSNSHVQFKALLDALSCLNDTGLIFTFPNADTGGYGLIEMLENFVAKHPNSRVYKSLGQLRYLSCIAQVDGVVGNSSSGLIEVPSFKKGTINIGDRQRGRMQASSVINCLPNCDSITLALQKLYSIEFQDGLNKVTNPYGLPGASALIVSKIKSARFDEIIKKRFYDLET